MKYSSFYLTGATGFLGRAVLNKLLESRAGIYAFIKKGDPLASGLPKNVKQIFGDILDIASVEKFLRKADEKSCVIHCSGIVSVASFPGKSIYDVNVGGTKNIIRACKKRKVGKLIYVSSVHAMVEKSKGVERDATEDVFAPKRGKGDYAKSKAMATRAVLRASRQGLNVSVVLPSGIIGPGDCAKGNITSMLLSFLSGKLSIAVQGGYDFVDVRDVATGILSCAEHGRCGSCYILSGHYATIQDILEIVSRLTNLRRKVYYIPIPLAKIIAPFCELDSLRKKRKPFFTLLAVSVLHSNASFSRKSAAQELGYAPRPLTETIEDTIIWLEQKGNIKRKKT